jgi:hypothetical protein
MMHIILDATRGTGNGRFAKESPPLMSVTRWPCGTWAHGADRYLLAGATVFTKDAVPPEWRQLALARGLYYFNLLADGRD